MGEHPGVCEHGSLRRQCLTCELMGEVADLRSRAEKAETMLALASHCHHSVTTDGCPGCV
jgi:hypothetical protein